jgi:hypothetical protein
VTQAKLLRIIWADWPALVCALSIPLIWAIAAAHGCVLGLSSCSAADITSFALPLNAAATTVLAWRCARVLRLFKHGQAVAGEVIALSVVRDRGRLEFAYTVGGERLQSWMPVHKTARVMALVPGQQVMVLVAAHKPRQAIVKDVFV